MCQLRAGAMDWKRSSPLKGNEDINKASNMQLLPNFDVDNHSPAAAWTDPVAQQEKLPDSTIIRQSLDPAAPLPIHGPAEVPGKQQKMAQAPGPLCPHQRAGRSSWLLAPTQASLSHCSHIGSEPTDGELSLPLPLVFYNSTLQVNK